MHVLVSCSVVVQVCGERITCSAASFFWRNSSLVSMNHYSLRKSRLASSFGKNQVCWCYGFGAALNGTFHMSYMNLGAAILEFNV
jgi:hypothetical protein